MNGCNWLFRKHKRTETGEIGSWIRHAHHLEERNEWLVTDANRMEKEWVARVGQTAEAVEDGGQYSVCRD